MMTPMTSWEDVTPAQRWRIVSAISNAWESARNKPLSRYELEILAERLFYNRLAAQSALIADDLADPAIAGIELVDFKRKVSARRAAADSTIYPTHMG